MNCFTRIWQSAVIASMFVAPLALAKVTIYMCGDSTMQDWAAGYCPKQGQGQDFHYWFDATKAEVVNRGQGGMAADGYYDMFWKKGCSAGNCIVEKLQAGDYAVIQFGINDVSKSDEAKFTVAMSTMAKEAQAKGAYPIIMSPIRRCYYDSPTAIHNSYRGYPARAKAIADSLNIPFIDMSEMVANYMISVGESYAQQFIFNYATSAEYSNLKSDQADQVHLQMNGANAFGRIITEQMRAHSDPLVKKLGDYMAPMYQVSVKVSPEGAAEATSINAYYPQGMTVMLKTIPKSGKKFLGWYDGNGNKVSGQAVSTVKSQYIYTFTMRGAATQYTAVYEGGTAQKYEGDGAALTAFPTTTPKSLDDVTFVPFTPMDGSQESTVPVDKNIKKFFDAYKPDSGLGTSDTNWAHTGLGFFNMANEKNSFATYKMKFPGAGYVTLAVRYANGGTSDRMFNAYLDHDYYVSAPPTGGWENWDTAYVVMDAPLGEAELKFISLTSDGAPNIDAFGFSIDDVCRVSEGCPEVSDTTDTTIALHAIAANAGVRLRGAVLSLVRDADVSVFDMRGRLVVRKVMAAGEVNLSTLVRANGLYRVVVRDGSSKFVATYAKVR
ncbi:GDSL-type esterase/lipase family protein [Fibrobacter sp. UWR2]|uniref:GDSL-type esterase/lipase family protein n=1 Tax=Fibrobacter sp. UWR2 TaxID=1964352 RepID=UPI000B527561|nr:GDSL-type esterase/lipase family protein [Fibrobacter sp. UWR2]OWV02389.1 carbohydrate-binding protein [Fibrobacter sp. UWR2]